MLKNLYAIKGGITAPKEFIAGGIAAGLKKGKLDLGLVHSKRRAICAGFFTSNKIKAAPVLLSSSIINKPVHRAVIINSGCANCLTGKKGLLDSKLITRRLAGLLGVKESEVLICSTGAIGKRLNAKKIISALPGLIKALSIRGAKEMAQAIMTTDTYPKQIARAFRVGDKEVRIGGVAKGAGMIAPNMATMLCVITTDADISKSTLKKACKEAVDASFNCITVDGDMSTNDTLLCFANGASEVKIEPQSNIYNKFVETLTQVSLLLANLIVNDGEGATKFIEIQITGAKTPAQAKKVAFGIANSNLVKTAVYGGGSNIGRIASACGAPDVDIRQNRLDIYVNGKKMIKGGIARSIKGSGNIFKRKNIEIECDLKLGKASHRVYTCDLSPKYMKINAEYN
ncbi:MAG: bifunctional glutamate N-acetyltransferase/amino-acid acetyltransferase ArgJ [Candidatus Omnitrophota bacterium]|nr:MAG: bifunctional glutamate N-acetyltransferase/amino-acid acetyltransferase ArgJ [Candidatus Omnitrophota bacterium]